MHLVNNFAVVTPPPIEVDTIELVEEKTENGRTILRRKKVDFSKIDLGKLRDYDIFVLQKAGVKLEHFSPKMDNKLADHERANDFINFMSNINTDTNESTIFNIQN